MSIARQLLSEFRPLFRMLEEPVTRSPVALRYNSLFNDLFFNSPTLARPAVDLSEEGNNYVIEAELPGVPKENVDVRIGDHGHSVTIEGKVTSRRGGGVPASVTENANAADMRSDAASATGDTSASTSNALTNRSNQPNQVSVERQFVGNTSFTRTVWLSRPVDGNSVSAHLKDGVLTLTLPKSEDKGSVKVSVE